MRLEKILNNFYFLEDIIPSFKKAKAILKITFILIVKNYTKSSIFIKYYLMNRQLEKQLKLKESGINVAHYSKVARVIHENKYGLTNSDYGSVKIDWDLFAFFRKKRLKIKDKEITDGFKNKAIRSTYSYDLGKRITY